MGHEVDGDTFVVTQPPHELVDEVAIGEGEAEVILVVVSAGIQEAGDVEADVELAVALLAFLERQGECDVNYLLERDVDAELAAARKRLVVANEDRGKLTKLPLGNGASQPCVEWAYCLGRKHDGGTMRFGVLYGQRLGDKPRDAVVVCIAIPSAKVDDEVAAVKGIALPDERGVFDGRL